MTDHAWLVRESWSDDGELLYTSLYSGGRGEGGLKFSHQNMHPPNKENMFPPNMEKTCSLVYGVPPWGPTFLPTLSTICGGCPPPWGGPLTSCPATRGCPLKGAPPKTAPTIRGILSPLAGTRCFPKLFLLKKSGRSQNISGTL